MKFYLVGGAVRDKLLGLRSKDLDFTAVGGSFDDLREEILNRGGRIYQERPEFATIRALVPGLGDADYVLARKDGVYSDGRRPDTIEVGTLLDDLSRRDFTVNAIAEDEEGNLVDPFGGQADLKAGILRCVGVPAQRFSEDYLRILRALRFSLTKGFSIEEETELAIIHYGAKLVELPSERIEQELKKMFEFSTLGTIQLLEQYPLVKALCFTKVNLRPTLKGLK